MGEVEYEKRKTWPPQRGAKFALSRRHCERGRHEPRPVAPCCERVAGVHGQRVHHAAADPAAAAVGARAGDGADGPRLRGDANHHDQGHPG